MGRFPFIDGFAVENGDFLWLRCLLEGMGCWIFWGKLHFVQWLYNHHFHDANSEIRGHTPFFTHTYDRRCLLNAIHMVTWTFNLRFSLYL
jgi:hypothetical protein